MDLNSFFVCMFCFVFVAFSIKHLVTIMRSLNLKRPACKATECMEKWFCLVA